LFKKGIRALTVVSSVQHMYRRRMVLESMKEMYKEYQALENYSLACKI